MKVLTCGLGIALQPYQHCYTPSAVHFLGNYKLPYIFQCFLRQEVHYMLLNWFCCSSLLFRVSMASRLTLFAEFDSSIEDWTSYSERFGFFLTANEIKDPGIQLSTLLSSVGSRRLNH